MGRRMENLPPLLEVVWRGASGFLEHTVFDQQSLRTFSNAPVLFSSTPPQDEPHPSHIFPLPPRLLISDWHAPILNPAEKNQTQLPGLYTFLSCGQRRGRTDPMASGANLSIQCVSPPFPRSRVGADTGVGGTVCLPGSGRG